MTRGWLRLLALGLATAWAGFASAQTQRITPPAAYAEVAHSGTLRHVQIDGDLDVTKLLPPAGAKRILMQDVQLEGTLLSSAGGPPVALLIGDGSRLRNLDLRGTRWAAPLAIENSSVQERAWFDAAQFDAAFTLHATTLDGQASFRGTRFAAPVEITASTFRTPASLGAVSFTDARFVAPARFDRSRFATDLRMDTSRFEADASFLGLEVAGRASWRNVVFGGDAEFRFCRLGDADFGDAEQMSVFMRLADFRACTMRSLHLDYVDARGDLLLVNVVVEPGDLTLTQASLRGARNDFSGLKVGGRLDLRGAQIANLQLSWFDIDAALARSRPGSDVLRPLQRRLEELKSDDDARAASAALSESVIRERLARPDASFADTAVTHLERIAWGRATGYGTRLGRIVGVALLAWLLLALPIVAPRGLGLGTLTSAGDKAPPLHHPVAATELQPPPARTTARVAQQLAYAFALLFTLPDLRLRPAAPLSLRWRAYLLLMRGVGLVLLALAALTLAKVSPIVQAVLGKIVG